MSTKLETSLPATSIQTALMESVDRLKKKHLLGDARDSISARMADRPAVIRANVTESVFPIEVPLHGSPDDPRLAIHREIYGRRSDVGVVVIAHSSWGARLAQLDAEMPAIFDEQIRQLGTAVPRWGSTAARDQLQAGGNAFVTKEGVICLGTSPDRAVFNLELLEKCAKSFVLAHLSGQKVGRIPRWVQWIASGRLRKDERQASEAFSRGEYPALTTGY